MTALAGAVFVALAGAAVCALVLIEPDWRGAADRMARRAVRALAVERVREDLAQAGMPWLPAEAWLALRAGASVVAGLVGYFVFGVLVLAAVACIATYHLLGLTLEHQRRRRQLERQQALLDAIRYGAAVMSRGGSASDMLLALAQNGPPLVRPVFGQLAERRDAEASPASLPRQASAVRSRVADPLFDDLALALILHWKRGARLVPALEAIVAEWSETVQLQRDARVLTAGVQASVMVLSVLPIVFLVSLQLLAPELLLPFRTPLGQALLAACVLWMVLGYRVLQRMAEPPREERLRIRESEL